MSDIVIQAEGLGKSYLIGHQGRRERYTALRDVLARQFRGMWGSTRRMLSGKFTVSGEQIEEFWALRDVSFEVKRGDVVGIIGRNGAGKSTLLKILSRITEPTEGRVTLRGRVASLLEVGTGFHPELTGRENIFLNGAILGMSRVEIKRKFDEIVAFAEVEQFLDTPVKRYSSGMYVRLAFAVAAHLEPEILVVDEVLAVGDAEFQKKCLGKMQEVSGEGRTVLFVSHNMGLIRSLCGTAMYLAAGKIQRFGTAVDVIQEYTAADAGLSEFQRTAPLSQQIAILSGRADVHYRNEQTILELDLVVRARSAKSVSLDVRLRDGIGAPVGLAPVGTMSQGDELSLPVGMSQVVTEHDITHLANGSYGVSLDLAEPMVCYHERLEGCLFFDLNAPLRNGQFRSFHQKFGFGSMELPRISSSCESTDDVNGSPEQKPSIVPAVE
jgi:lipopolysaccharide transport system ATP-binding protein